MPNPPLTFEEEKELDDLRFANLDQDEVGQLRRTELQRKKIEYLKEQEEKIKLRAETLKNDENRLNAQLSEMKKEKKAKKEEISNHDNEQIKLDQELIFKSLKSELNSLGSLFFSILWPEKETELTIDNKLSKINKHIKNLIDKIKKAWLERYDIEILIVHLISICFRFFSMAIDICAQKQNQYLKSKIIDLSMDVFIDFQQENLSEENRKEVIDQLIGFYTGNADISDYLIFCIRIQKILISFKISGKNYILDILHGLRIKLKFESPLIDNFIEVIKLYCTTNQYSHTEAFGSKDTLIVELKYYIIASIFICIHKLITAPALLKIFLSQIAKCDNLESIKKVLDEFRFSLPTLAIEGNGAVLVQIEGKYISFTMGVDDSFFNPDNFYLQNFISIIKKISITKNISFEKKRNLIKFLLEQFIVSSKHNDFKYFSQLLNRCETVLIIVNRLADISKDFPKIKSVQEFVSERELETLVVDDISLEVVLNKLVENFDLGSLDDLERCCLHDAKILKESIRTSFLNNVLSSLNVGKTKEIVYRYRQLISDIREFSNVDKINIKDFEDIYLKFSFFLSSNAKLLFKSASTGRNQDFECVTNFKKMHKVFGFLTKLFNSLQSSDKSMIKYLRYIIINFLDGIKIDDKKIKLDEATSQLLKELGAWLNQLSTTNQHTSNFFPCGSVTSEQFKLNVLADMNNVTNFFSQSMVSAPATLKRARPEF